MLDDRTKLVAKKVSEFLKEAVTAFRKHGAVLNKDHPDQKSLPGRVIIGTRCISNTDMHPLTALVGGQTVPDKQVILIREVVMRTFLVVAALALSLPPALAQQAAHTMVNADEVQWKEAPPILPGAQTSILYGDPAKEGMFVMRLKFPANYRVPPHTHPVDEIVTVISGEFNIGMGREFDKAQTKPYTAGGLIAMPPGTEHFVYTDQETVIQISTRGPWALNFVNPGDKAQVTR